MLKNGYNGEFAERCFSQIEGFGSYGFPESHAASFAFLVYASAWIKCHHPGIFACALLNSQPMGFYAPAQIVRDAKEHGVEVRTVSINDSYWDNVMEPDGHGELALRLGFARSRDCGKTMQLGSQPRGATGIFRSKMSGAAQAHHASCLPVWQRPMSLPLYA